MNVDLHMHTSCSDGVYTPEELLTMAETAQLGEISITDHDTVEAYSHPCVVSSSVSVIRGIEISTEYNGEDIHVLGYYIHTEHKAIAEYCQTFHQRRLERALQIVDRLAGLGYELDRTPLEGLIKQGVAVGRPHIARMLIEKGYFATIADVFQEVLHRGAPAYVPYQRCTIEECIELIHEAGGVAVLAHPGLIQHNLQAVLPYAFDGIEVFHPKNRGRENEFMEIAKTRHWLISGGSDFHGVPGRFPEVVGQFYVPSERLHTLLEYRRKK